MIVISPHNYTPQVGGYGPTSEVDGGWMDWHPRYAEGGADQAYDTPPPRFESHLLERVIPFVDDNFPTVGHRDYRAIDGFSQGGFGSFRTGFRHPDLFASVGSTSGAPAFGIYNPLDGREPDALGNDLTADHPLTYQGHFPQTVNVGLGFVMSNFGGYLGGPRAVSFLTWGMGDMASDSAYNRANNPGPDLISNLRAWNDGVQSIYVRHYVGNDVTSYPENAMLVENLVYYWQGFEQHGVERTFFIRPGNHSDYYWGPFVRGTVEDHYAHLRHKDGGGEPPPWPTVFDYRAVENDFTIWGWTVPDEPAIAGASKAYGNTVTVELDDL